MGGTRAPRLACKAHSQPAEPPAASLWPACLRSCELRRSDPSRSLPADARQLLAGYAHIFSQITTELKALAFTLDSHDASLRSPLQDAVAELRKLRGANRELKRCARVAGYDWDRA
eukprot:6556958-Prymnesium_polylepis.1